ncbi:hypothetical protein ACQW02_15260 [Humitalea sp. 24SJ18S-53]|uniref:hypothetical protein n=1 Tax=Humitalea sp. 24SJ18S-53 TaxID=3422307 RepID=UPI003D668F00
MLMKPVSRSLVALMLLGGMAGCAPPGAQNAEAVSSLAPEASLDARSLGRGVAAARPASVQVQDDPSNPTIVYAVSPRLQTGSLGSLPMIVTSFGAERQRSDASTAYRALVVISNARAYANFARATTRQGDSIPVQALSRDTQCGGVGGCLFVETLLLTFTADAMRQAAEAGTPLRVRLTGSAAFVEVGIPPGHVRVLLAATQP